MTCESSSSVLRAGNWNEDDGFTYVEERHFRPTICAVQLMSKVDERKKMIFRLQDYEYDGDIDEGGNGIEEK